MGSDKGGVSTGIHLAGQTVIACVNHDAEAIKCHQLNHPEAIHFTEDIRDWNVIVKLKDIVTDLRNKEPDCIINIWSSAECTHFSKAKGGMSRDADSRTLSEHLIIYEEELKPDGIFIENVEEFLSWGPLDKKGKIIKELKGIYYEKWRDDIKSRGFKYDYKILNSADYGASTSRSRYFGIFKKSGNISLPKQTHIEPGKYNPKKLPLWEPVRDILQLEEEGVSIFGLNGRNKPWATKTMLRVYKGMKKSVELGDEFLISYYGNGNSHTLNKPCNTLTTKERYAKVHMKRKWLVDTQYDNTGRSLNKPCQTLIAKMNKKPIYLISSNSNGETDNSVEKIGVRPIERLMRYYMRKHGISDVKIRMLFLEELMEIQGFPKNYILTGTKEDKLKFIGNSVVPLMAEELVRVNYLNCV